MKYSSSLKAKLIYVFRINDAAHKGCLKIGEATLDSFTSLDLKPNCHELNQAAKARINQYTQTAGIDYDLLHTEITFYILGGTLGTFNDKEVHDVLRRSGIKRHNFSREKQGTEWFECDLQTVLQAIHAVKTGQSALDAAQITTDHNPIAFRPEQKEAIQKTVRKFSKQGTHMLWNAKMRFGKTLSSLEVVKQCRFHRTLILTHRPVVDVGWFEDFGKIFYEDKPKDVFRYGSKNNGHLFAGLERDAQHNKAWHYVYFASMQDLRGSSEVGGKFDKNDQIFRTEWDCLIIDEAHEGTQTQLGQNVIEALRKSHTCVLNLSGTPFNLLDDFNEDEVYTWDYVMEQHAKQQWDLDHFGDPNPYASLPRLNIFTFDLGRLLQGYSDVEDRAFNFKEFFRTWTGNPGKDHIQMPAGTQVGRFVHEPDVRRFLDLIVKYDKESNYPFSTVEYRRNFRHSLWMVPGVKEARALSTLLQQHPIFSQFQIVNVAGEGDEEADSDEALKMVERAMGDDPEDSFTITLSCGRLTTGVTVRPWTAVFMLAGSAQTDAKAYMQTIFRVQSPYETRTGRRKEECFVFDFAPDRTLKVIAQVAKVTAKAGKVQTDDDKSIMGRFLNFCPIIGYNGTRMEKLHVDGMLERLKQAYIDRVVRHGFEDAHLYNDNLLKLDAVELKKFDELKKQIGATKANHSSGDVDINQQGLSNEEYEQLEKAKKKKKNELTEEEKRLLEEMKEKKKNKATAISILRGISIRFPLLIYGAELASEDEDVTIENFASLIDDQSWEEFMPRGVTKEKFQDFVKYYDPDVFRASGRQIRDMARAADTLQPMERVKRISAIFSYFRNPDKETVLTPWRVVNMHMSDCLGGWDFYDETHDEQRGKLQEPRFVDRGEVTQQVFTDPDTRILEINSKTGLYPLYVAYSVFAERCRRYRDDHMLATDLPDEQQMQLWDKTLAENIFVICKTPMAKSITRRTLRGFRHAKVNARYFEDLINTIQNKSKQFIERISNGKSYWKANNIEDMKFNAIVGNPPYQVIQSTDKAGINSAFASAIYPKFIEMSRKLCPMYLSLVTPSRWMTKTGQGIPEEWVDDMINSNHFISMFDYYDALDCFERVEIKGGVSYFLYSENYEGVCQYVLKQNNNIYRITDYLNALGAGIVVRDPFAINIIKKVQQIEGEYFDEKSFSNYVSPQHFFDKDGLLTTSWKGYSKKNDIEHSVKYYVSPQTESQGFGWISKNDIPKNTQVADIYKVYLSKAYNGGDNFPHQIIGNPRFGERNSVCSQTYLVIGYDVEKHNFSKRTCDNIISYMKTLFFRYMVFIKKKTQDNPSSVFQFVPLQDFSYPWTDEMLYAKYNLTVEEIAYIESLIKPMDGDAEAPQETKTEIHLHVDNLKVEGDINTSGDVNIENYQEKK